MVDLEEREVVGGEGDGDEATAVVMNTQPLHLHRLPVQRLTVPSHMRIHRKVGVGVGTYLLLRARMHQITVLVLRSPNCTEPFFKGGKVNGAAPASLVDKVTKFVPQ